MGRYPVDRPMTRHGMPQGYWEVRKNQNMYKIKKKVALHYAGGAKTAIDVGCYVGGFICELDWIPKRTAYDVQDWSKEWADVDNVKFKKANAFELEFNAPIDLVISNQTIEHVEDAAGFAEKLCALGNLCLVSTTYMVPHGEIEGHVQDPIDFEKFVSWFPRPPKAVCVVYEKPYNNIVGVF